MTIFFNKKNSKFQFLQIFTRNLYIWIFAAKIIFFFYSSLLTTYNNELSTSCEDLDYETEHEHRKRELNKNDIVYTVDLREYFQTQIRNLYGQLGETRYTEIMSNVDVETMKNMQEFITV